MLEDIIRKHTEAAFEAIKPVIIGSATSGNYQINDKYRIFAYLEDSNGEDDSWISLSLETMSSGQIIKLAGTDTEDAESEDGLKKALADCMKQFVVRISSKEQEKEALELIRGIIRDLGENSYVGAAFEGCSEIAEANIRDDAMCSLKQRLEQAERELEILHDRISMDNEKIRSLELQAGHLSRLLELEQEWEDYTDPDAASQEEYNRLKSDPSGRVLTDGEARDLVCRDFGFDPGRVQVFRDAPVYQKNRHGTLREIRRAERVPVYHSSDWNYVRFGCGGIVYEMHDGDLRMA